MINHFLSFTVIQEMLFLSVSVYIIACADDIKGRSFSCICAMCTADLYSEQSTFESIHTKVKRLGPKRLNSMQNGCSCVRVENVRRRSASQLTLFGTGGGGLLKPLENVFISVA